MRFLLGAVPHNQHLANIARALSEAGVLGMYHTGSVDHYSSTWGAMAREALGRALPSIDRRLDRRKIPNLPPGSVHPHRGWDDLGTLAKLLGLSESIRDAIWERGENHFDVICESLIHKPEFTAFLGAEYGCLRSVQAARRLGKKSVVAFLSPHHSVLDKWVWPEYRKFPELLTPYACRLIRKMKDRTERKDAEARSADCIHTASQFTADSLVAAGMCRKKMTVVPLGCPPALAPEELPALPGARVKVVYSGPVSVRKGAHYLLSAWRLLGGTADAELHLYGTPLLPRSCFEETGANVYVHGHVSKQEMQMAYTQASVVVFPTLCDGFGMVVAEAMSRGTPVITTPNAGAAHLIVEGKTGFLVPPVDAESLAVRLDWCIRHPRELHAMRGPALAKAQNWTWTEFRQEFLRQTSAIIGRFDE